MRIEVRTVSVSRNSWSLPLVDQYIRKILPFEKIEFKNYKSEDKLFEGLSDRDRLWVCDERGQAVDSRNFAKKIERLRDSGTHRLVLFIGGPFGLPKELLEKADHQVLLSPFVLNQEVALTVLLEQLFRAYTIINNHPYHND